MVRRRFYTQAPVRQRIPTRTIRPQNRDPRRPEFYPSTYTVSDDPVAHVRLALRHEPTGRVISTFIAQALAKEPITVFGDGTQTRSSCHVDDPIDGPIGLMDAPDLVPGPTHLGRRRGGPRTRPRIRHPWGMRPCSRRREPEPLGLLAGDDAAVAVQHRRTRGRTLLRSNARNGATVGTSIGPVATAETFAADGNRRSHDQNP